MILALTVVPLVIVAIIAFVFIIGIIIAIHEAGHFFFAKKAGILCYEFSIGMGPIIYKKQFGETSFKLRAIPIGGFVSMANEAAGSFIKLGDEIGLNFDDDKVVTEIVLDDALDCNVRGKVLDFDLEGNDGNPLFITVDDGMESYFPIKSDAFYVFEKNQRMQITPYDRTFDSKSLWQRFITLLAGPVNNLILGFFLYLIIAFATGVPNYSSNTIAATTQGYNAMEVLESGDQIVKLGDKDVSSWTEFSKYLDEEFSSYNTNINITVLRDGKELNYNIEATTYIASIGLSNIQASKDPLIFNNQSVDGLRVGNVSLRYKDSSGSNPIKFGDILTGVKVGNKSIVELGLDEGKASWGDLAKLFDETNIEDVKFSYYSFSANKLISIDECETLEPYGNELLSNQRIQKIQMTLGVSVQTHFDLFGCISLAGTNFANDFTLIFNTLAIMIHPSDVRQVGVSDLSSFVGIFGLVERYVGAGLLPLLSLFAMLSINVGVVNLLPIPALDGGRIVFLGYELITRKKINKKVEAIINNVCFILILILFVFVTYNDILRMFG